MPAIFSVHPRTRKRLESKGFKLSPYIKEEKPFGFFEYVKLEENAYVVLSDSGTLSEESSILDFPGVLIRTSTERQEANIHGSIVLGGVDYDSIKQGIEEARAIHKGNVKLKIVPDYDTDEVSSIVSKTIAKYIDIVNKETWLKE